MIPGLILRADDMPADGQYFELVIRPFLADLLEHRHRFEAPPLIHKTGYIDLQGTRWLPPDAPPEIEFYVAADRSGYIPQTVPSLNGGSPGLLKAWVVCPVDVPLAMRMRARPITEGEL